MTDKDTENPSLDGAYALETPEDSRRLYANWAETYDQTFAQAHDYLLPLLVAQAYKDEGGTGLVLDVGAGTGLCGQELIALNIGPVDATDISQEMLNVAATKSIYRTLFAGDLTARLAVEDDTYAGVVSSGTFTNGHVGPEAFDELLRITQPGGLLALSINTVHYDAKGFKAKLQDLDGQITDLHLPEVRIYGESATDGHKDDTVYIALFRKA
ncbi:Methyltransferase domain-containing protein [Shimia gijangensis]|uniref:Methyltransferase domain-containing protein n=1 Tax=Shimia gijangensis TaxID=1470563 RepID=A0A1M6ATR0_9RHOB|nr:class I SAM-dependent methyltransferase [Shimia gijangensis]SHI39909.1 Methyltransferase domain-containing protein [Shimia gijangensis]